MTSESRDLWKDHNSLSQPGCLNPFGTNRGTSPRRALELDKALLEHGFLGRVKDMGVTA